MLSIYVRLLLTIPDLALTRCPCWLAGNTAYKAKRFDEAIQHYTKALELYDADVSFLTNRAAVYIEMGSFDKCIEDCDTAVEKARAARADYKLIARALTRKGTALMKQDKLEDAIQVGDVSLGPALKVADYCGISSCVLLFQVSGGAASTSWR